jgi:hypothetical protein
VVSNVSRDGESCRIFIQRSGENDPCFACYAPDVTDSPTVQPDRSCAPTPAIADILPVAVGFATRAAIGEILRVPIGEYNCRDITFGGIDIKKTITKKTGCALCGNP